MKLGHTLLLMQSIILVVAVTFGVIVFSTRVCWRPAAIDPPPPTRFEINDAVAKLITVGRGGEVFAFYAMEVGDPLKASLYVMGALQAGVPVDEYISQGWWEGGHQVGTLAGPNPNGSYDALPAGLNTFAYRQYTAAELREMQFNIPEGAAHLRRDFQALRDKVNDDTRWDVALVRYNKGSVESVGTDQIRYVARILRHEWELDRRFAMRFPEAF
jgi:hypothetical protein